MQKRVAILFPAPAGKPGPVELADTRFADVAAALRSAGLAVEAAPYTDEAVDEVRQQLLQVAGVLSWINPIEGDRDRSILNAMLADVAGLGVFVSARPDVIDRLGTKEVLYRTRTMSWGCDTRLYESLDDMRRDLPARLAGVGACVLKQVRGNGGNGIWKIEPADRPFDGASDAARMRVRHAKRGSLETEMTIAQFTVACAPYFENGGGMIDQPYQVRFPLARAPESAPGSSPNSNGRLCVVRNMLLH